MSQSADSDCRSCVALMLLTSEQTVVVSENRLEVLRPAPRSWRGRPDFPLPPGFSPELAQRLVSISLVSQQLRALPDSWRSGVALPSLTLLDLSRNYLPVLARFLSASVCVSACACVRV